VIDRADPSDLETEDVPGLCLSLVLFISSSLSHTPYLRQVFNSAFLQIDAEGRICIAQEICGSEEPPGLQVILCGPYLPILPMSIPIPYLMLMQNHIGFGIRSGSFYWVGNSEGHVGRLQPYNVGNLGASHWDELFRNALVKIKLAQTCFITEDYSPSSMCSNTQPCLNGAAAATFMVD
jgi:hypothetical protein